MEQQKKVTFGDILKAMKQLPGTINILSSVDKKLFSLLVFFSLLSGVLPVVSILITQGLINSIVDVANRSMQRTLILVGAFIGYNVLSYLLAEVTSYVTSIYQYKLQYGLQHRMMSECSKMELKNFEQAHTYDKVEKLTTEIAFRPYQMFMAVISIFTSAMSLVSVLTILVLWKPFAALGMLIIPVLAVMYYLRIGQKEFEIMWNRAGGERKLWYYNHLMTHDFSFKEMKVLNISDYILEKFKEASDGFIAQNKTILNQKTFFNVLYGFAIYLLSGVVIGLSVADAYLGHILVGNVMSIIRSVSMVQSESKSIMTGLYIIYSCSLYMQMLQEFLKENNKEQGEVTPIDDTIQEISMNHVSYSYDGKHNALEDVNLKFQKGKRIAIVGPNGSGKSTLLKLMVGLYRPEKGDIQINGVKSTALETASYYERISVLFQDFVKYELSLKENVGFGDIKNMDSEEQIRDSLNTDRTTSLEGEDGTANLQMQLGNWFEDGRELSQGQWQKVALSRIYMKDADCYMLDEPNAALDTLSEKDAFDRFFRLSEDKLGIYISHRLCAAKKADEIVVMQQGHVVDVGTHDQLIERCKVYQDMYEAENYAEAG